MASELEVGKVKVGTEGFTPHASVDDLVVAPSDVAAGMTIRAGSDSGTSRIAFADISEPTVGLITYDHNTDNLTLAADDDIVLSSGAGTGSLNLDASGDVTVGTGGTGTNHTKLIVDGTSGANRGPRIEFKRNSVLKNIIGSESGIVGNSSDDLLIFSETGNAVKIGAGGNASNGLTVGSTGLVTFSNGINLGNQTMSSYQTGDWYPLLYYQNGTDVTIGGTAYASQGVGNYTVTWGHYVKVGKLVHVEGYLKVTTATTGSFANDNIGIMGLPFSHRNATNANAMLMINTTKNWGNTIASGVVGPNSTVAVCQTSSGGGNLADDIGAVTNLQVWINGTYFTEA